MLRTLIVSLVVSLAVAGATVAAPLDPNVRAEALRHLAIIEKEATILAQLTEGPGEAPAAAEPAQPGASASGAPTAADANRVSRTILEAASTMRAEVAGAQDTDKLIEQHSDLDEAVDELQPVLRAFPPRKGARTRFSNLRWSTQRLAAVLEFESEETPTFTVGPMTAEQAANVRDKMAALLSRANLFKVALQKAPPDMMYRNLLISQMEAFVEPSAKLTVELRDGPWWTPEAYQAVTQCQRLVDLTKNETRKLTPELLEQAQKLWASCEELVAAANDIEQGARGTGPDAKIQYLEKPKGR